ncbi:MAG: hypothetical protein II623_05910, partial [Paludibacteraceae bacterium]|nr:hypothetical protein [Paludibacteraceae bacterium]
EKALMDGSFNKGREEGEAIGLVKGRAEGEAIGLEKGEAIGLEKGVKKEKIDNARKMKECGVDIHIISTVTGLSADEIENL